VPGPGDFVLLYPKWIPATIRHRQINKVAGFAQPPKAGLRLARQLTFTPCGRCRGVTAIDAEFQYLCRRRRTRDASSPRRTWRAQWIELAYPAGYFVRDIPVQASIIARRLEGSDRASRSGRVGRGSISRQATKSDDLPLIAGAHYRRSSCPASRST
jgi:hypothetical protein